MSGHEDTVRAIIDPHRAHVAGICAGMKPEVAIAYLGQYDDALAALAELVADRDRLAAERDEARHQHADALQGLEYVRDELLDQAITRCNAAEAERDELRALVDKMKSSAYFQQFADRILAAEARNERLEAELAEWKQAAGAEADAADWFRARLVAAKTSQPDWTTEGWDQFIRAALASAGGEGT